MKARRVKNTDPQAPLADNAARIVRLRLRELRSFAPQALKPDDTTAQHDMRIAAKRLRYVLELTEFCFGKSAAISRRRARDLQDLLGELHDCDVMLPRVGRHLSDLRDADATAVHDRAGDASDLDPRFAARAPHRTAYRGLEILTVHLQARRRLLFDRFREFWTKHEREGTWDHLERAAADRLDGTGERLGSGRPAGHRESVEGPARTPVKINRPKRSVPLRSDRVPGRGD
jgi:hypothetical protein